MNSSKSEATARAILDEYVVSAERRAQDQLEAIILVGSLATGSYIPGPGDIDQITVLADTASETAEEGFLRLIEEVTDRFNYSVNLAPVVYRRRDLERPWSTSWDLRAETKHLVTVPEELLRIHDHGLVLLGAPSYVSQLPKPLKAEILDYHQRWKAWGHQFTVRNPQWDVTRMRVVPCRISVQIILSTAIWHYYYATGRTCFNKHTIGQRLREDVPRYRYQFAVDRATRVRLSGFGTDSAELQETLKAWCLEMRSWQDKHEPDDLPVDN